MAKGLNVQMGALSRPSDPVFPKPNRPNPAGIRLYIYDNKIVM
jgi:hypothetical protein